MTATNMFHGVGRRKSSVARVWLKSGSGKFVVNGKTAEDFFDTEHCKNMATLPLYLLNKSEDLDILVNVNGGGFNGQASAIQLGISRALLELDSNNRSVLKSQKLLTVDSRIKERKKPGQKGARKKFQFVKR